MPAIKKPVKLERSVIIRLIIISVSIFLLISFISSFGNIDRPLNMYYRGIQKNEINDFINAFPPQVEKIFIDKSVIDNIPYEDFKTKFDQDYANNYNIYGERFRVRYTVKVKEYWSKEEINAQKNNLYDIWRIPKSSVKDIITVNLQIVLRGSGNEQSYTMTHDMIKIYGKWYVYPDYDAFMNPIP
ncbi:MAG: hypothetical protein WC332_10905, partial [Clostridia bacterium]|jgi:hypothetical protein